MNPVLWTDKTVAEAAGGRAEGGAFEATRVEIDSRRVRSGDLFVALKGDRFDGHNFIREAFSRGAAAALVSHLPHNVSGPVVVVKDTLIGLQAMGKYARQRSQAKVVGITGSVGKTSTKEIMQLALSAHGETFASRGNTNNHIGVPLNLANLPPGCLYAVIEMGMNHKGEIAALTQMARPHVAIITGVEAVHLEFFRSVEEIAMAKAEIFAGLAPGGAAVLNADNPHFDLLQRAAVQRKIEHIIACGENKKAECRLDAYRGSLTGCSIRAAIGGKEITYAMQAIGRHWALPSLMALAAVAALKLDPAVSARALLSFSEPVGRGRVTPITIGGKRILLIDDSYNASPASMRAAFAKTAEVWEAAGRKGRKVAVLGDMLELGKDTLMLHAELAPSLVRYGFNLVFTAGQRMEALYNALPPTTHSGHAKAPLALLPALKASLQNGDIVLVKGSHGSKAHELAEALIEEAQPVEGSRHAV